MPYNNNIPQPNDSPMDSQVQLLQNFQEISEFASRDHVALGNPDSGLHRRTTYINVASPVGTNNSVTVWSEQEGGNQQLFYRREQSAESVNLTGGFFRSSGQTNNPSGYSRMPSGVIVKWGVAETDGSGQFVVDTAIAGSPSFSEGNFLVQLTVENDAEDSIVAYLRERNGEQFTINTRLPSDASAPNIRVMWMAMGNSQATIIP